VFEKNDKRRLYQLMDMYLKGTITASVFCDEFYYSYDLELDDAIFTDLERQAFSDLSTLVGRFSPYEEDHLGLPHGFYTEAELRNKILETKEKLKEQNSNSA
jgi:hypothetical protein